MRDGSRTAAVGAALLMLANAASAYVYDTADHARWPGPTIPVVVQLGRAPSALQDGSLSFNHSIENAMTLWNQQMANAQFLWTEEPRTTAAAADGITTITFENTVYGDAFGSSTLAITIVTSSGGRMVETDIMFNIGR